MIIQFDLNGGIAEMPFLRRRERGLSTGNTQQECGKMFKRIYPNKTVVEGPEKITQSVPIGTVREITWDSLNPGPPYRSGDNFASVKFSPVPNGIREHGSYTTRPAAQFIGSPVYEYSGGFVRPNYTWNSFTATLGLNPFSGSTFASLSSLGPEAFKKLKPRLEKAGLAVALAEARDLPRMLRTTSEGFHDIWKSMGGNPGNMGSAASAMMQPKKVANNFLNHQFGWVPFISDILKFDDVLRNSQKYMAKVSANNNTWVKKTRVHSDTSYDVLLSKEDTIWGSVPGIRPWDFRIESCVQPYLLGGSLRNGSHEQRMISIDHTWFEGSFKYYRHEFDRTIPNYDSAWNEARRMQTLLGARINPSVLYKATPWTWLIDWFSNVGDVIDNATEMANDQLVSRYLYLMCHKTSILRHTVVIPFWDNPISITWDQNIDTKQRERYDNPFGLSLSLPLTARQLAILAALGISRG